MSNIERLAMNGIVMVEKNVRVKTNAKMIGLKWQGHECRGRQRRELAKLTKREDRVVGKKKKTAMLAEVFLSRP